MFYAEPYNRLLLWQVQLLTQMFDILPGIPKGSLWHTVQISRSDSCHSENRQQNLASCSVFCCTVVTIGFTELVPLHWRRHRLQWILV